VGASTPRPRRRCSITDTEAAPWTVIKSNDKKRGRVEAMHHVLNLFPYDGKDEDLVGRPDERIVSSAASVLEHGERSDRVFPEV
jgi:hypothetical protein